MVKIPLPLRLTLLGSREAEMKKINKICEIGVKSDAQNSGKGIFANGVKGRGTSSTDKGSKSSSWRLGFLFPGDTVSRHRGKIWTRYLDVHRRTQEP